MKPLSDKAQKMLDYFKENDVQRVPINNTKLESQAPHVQELINAGYFMIDKKHRDLVLIKESKIEILKRMIREEVRKVRLKEDTFSDEVEELAIQLIDYLGTELPATGWKTNPRIVGWFKENGIKINTPIAQDIYRRALELNQDNEPKSRKYLDN